MLTMKIMPVRIFIFPALLLTLLTMTISFQPKASDEVKNHANNNIIQIDIWSDMVCPFCYIGKKKLEKAIRELDASDRVKIHWHSFQLDPDMEAGKGVPATAHLLEKKGIAETQLNAIYDQLSRSGTPYGIEFRFENCISFNTRDAHRIWQWTKSLKKDSAWKESIMHAYFTEGKDLSSHESLLEIALQIGLDSAKTTAILSSDEYGSQVDEDRYLAQQLNITGVPFFIINRSAAISGAQDDRVFLQVLKKALEK